MIREELFGDWGSSLNDDDFACALAALGVAYAREHSWPIQPELSAEQFSMSEGDEPILWSLPPRECYLLTSNEPHLIGSAEAFADAWKTSVTDRSPRIACLWFSHGDWLEYDEYNTPWLIEQISLPAVKAGSVFLKCRSSTPVSWRWPLRIGLDPGTPLCIADHLSEHLSILSRGQTLAEVYPLSRQRCECDLAVLLGKGSEALAWLLRSTFDIRASCLILLGGMGEGYDALRLLEPLRAKIGAHGLVVSEQHRWTPIYNTILLLTQLSLNVPLDVAVQTAFRQYEPETPLCFYSDELLERARLTTVGQRLSQRLAYLGDTPLEVGPRANAILGFSAAPAAFVADKLLERLKDLPFDHEYSDASGLAQLREAAHAAQDQNLRPEPRYIQARVERQEGQQRPTRAFTARVRHVVAIKVGLPDEGWLQPSNRDPFPDEALPPGREDYLLRVTFSEPDHIPEPLTGQILLPKTGNSDEVHLAFTPVAGKPNFRGRIIVSFRNRILQTALLTGPVLKTGQPEPGEGRIELTAEANVRPVLHDLGDRTAYDLALAFNHDPTGRPTMTILDKDRAQLHNIEGTKKTLASIDDALSRVAINARDYAKGLKEQNGVEVLRLLAVWGVELYRFMKRATHGTPMEQRLNEAEYIQVVDLSDGFSIFPVEYVYSGACPKDDAGICPRYEEALLIGKCREACDQDKQAGRVVCPLEFWGLSKVIERHAFPPTDRDRFTGDSLVLAQPVGTRNTLNISGEALLAASTKVVSSSLARLKSNLDSITKTTAVTVGSWQEWLDAISNRGPSFMVALPHRETKTISGYAFHYLEINQDTCKCQEIDARYVLGSTQPKPPLVILLGCETADPNTPLGSFILAFLDGGAAIVIGTVAKVLGEHAVDAAAELSRHLFTQARNHPVPFGEVMRDVRRACLADGLLMILGVAAFGDADWLVSAS